MISQYIQIIIDKKNNELAFMSKRLNFNDIPMRLGTGAGILEGDEEHTMIYKVNTEDFQVALDFANKILKREKL